MRKIILFAVLALLSNIAFCQAYNIKFEVIEKASVLFGQEWDFSYKPHKNMIVDFDGQWLKVNYKESGKTFLFEQIDDVKVVEIYDEYVPSKLKSKNYILRVNKKGYYEYYVIKHEYLTWSHLKSLHIPAKGEDGIIFSYLILQSDFIKNN